MCNGENADLDECGVCFGDGILDEMVIALEIKMIVLEYVVVQQN